MRKAVAVPYIIALILGVAVIGLVGYWFVTTGGKFGGQSAKTICDNKFLQHCVTNPSKSYADFVGGNVECSGLGSFTQCSEVLGTTSGSSPGTGNPPCGALNQCCKPGNICNPELKCQSGTCKQCISSGMICTASTCCQGICTFETGSQVWKCP